jgi:hypothetical protein
MIREALQEGKKKCPLAAVLRDFYWGVLLRLDVPMGPRE